MIYCTTCLYYSQCNQDSSHSPFSLQFALSRLHTLKMTHPRYDPWSLRPVPPLLSDLPALCKKEALIFGILLSKYWHNSCQAVRSLGRTLQDLAGHSSVPLSGFRMGSSSWAGEITCNYIIWRTNTTGCRVIMIIILPKKCQCK